LFFYNDDDTSDCCSLFSHLIIGGDDIRFEDVDATFILRIHGMILLICTEPFYFQIKIKFILNEREKYPTNKSNKENFFNNIYINFS